MRLVDAVNALRAQGRILAYHDRSDGGLFAAACEMAFAGHVGVALNVDLLVTEGDGISDSRADHGDAKNWAAQVGPRRDELTLQGAVQRGAGRAAAGCARAERNEVMQVLREHGLSKYSHFVGTTRPASSAIEAGKGEVQVWRDTKAVFSARLCRPAPGLGQRELEDLPAARQPGRRRCRACGRRRPGRPGLAGPAPAFDAERERRPRRT